ncbi:predicted protein [Scheffersomyces stipitis CBS 6054]|uniref:J domain-containing protein n=1 Tax=Scheffersomyces stipitis (strain ATCC 58785 / CBS 6054 / NBRC 10063 / NRRL Y-11545) TaxID=322104 RepID=A3LYT7_PICST|nr:predicted protein [Scheffersomyces stipitis CBS 6054]ABN68227.2 predicted protein [Scheffersomyces stipitis CBS 6054]KAG2731465.1 hypothetical protein G9P44_005881 [Scheffersomyces stipitis]
MSTAGSQDYYGLLGLPQVATIEEIKKAYKKLSLKYHPDKTPNKEHHELFIKLNEAYDTLKDPETKQKYDQKIGLSSSSSSSSYTTNHSYNPYSRSTNYNATGHAGTYFSFYQHFYGRKDDSVRRAEEEKARIYKEQLEKLHAEQEKRRQQELLRKQEEERLRAAAEAERQRVAAQEATRAARDRLLKKLNIKAEEEERRRVQKQQEEDYFEEEYKQAKKNASQQYQQQSPYVVEDFFDRQYYSNTPHSSPEGKSYYSSESSGHGHNSSDPIVLDDEEGQDSDEDLAGEEKKAEITPEPAEVDSNEINPISDEEERASSSDESDTLAQNFQAYEHLGQTFGSRPRARPRVNMRSLSPRRNINQATSNARDTPLPRNSSKKPRTSAFTFDDISDSLGQNIETIDYTDLFNSLPRDVKGRRKMSENMTTMRPKRAKFAEYSNGTSRAETLSTPLNKNSVRGHEAAPSSTTKSSRLSELDFHASPTIHNCTPPEPPIAVINPNIDAEGWQKYVESIQNYQQKFMKYNQLIIQYQTERSAKDQQYYEVVNGDPATFEVYHKCLQRDLEVSQEFTESLRIFADIMRVYKQNCDWMSTRHGNNGI